MSAELSIILPAFNEERTIEAVIRSLLATGLPVRTQLIVVDDHSSDGTAAEVQRLAHYATMPITLLRNDRRLGKSACIRKALEVAQGQLAVVQDADLEYDPADLPQLLGPLLEGRADLVCGSRFLRCRWPAGMAWPNWLANRLVTWLANRLYGLHLTDVETCYKVVRLERLRRFNLRSRRFEYEVEVIAKAARTGAVIHELPIRYQGRTRSQGKKIRAIDLMLAIWTLLRCLREPV